MRLDKSFRVILNSPIFPKMTVERATDRSVRFGAQDESQLRVFIIKVRSSSNKSMINLYSPKSLQRMIAVIYAKNYNPVFRLSNDNNHQIHRYVFLLCQSIFIFTSF
jgi:hypothetical protein